MAEEKNSIATVVKSLMDGAESVLTSKTVVGAPVVIRSSVRFPMSQSDAAQVPTERTIRMPVPADFPQR